MAMVITAGTFHHHIREFATRGNFELIIEGLNANPALIDVLDAQGRTPLLSATKHGHLELVNLFLDRGPHTLFTPYSYNGSIPIHFAAQNGHQNIFWRLIEAVPQPHPQEIIQHIVFLNDENQTPLYFAGASGNLELFM